MRRDIELAKKLLESKGYKVSKVNESVKETSDQDSSHSSEEQIGEYHIYSPAVKGKLYITVYNAYGDIEYYVFEPGDTESIRFDDLGELCDAYKLDPDDFEDNKFGGN